MNEALENITDEVSELAVASTRLDQQLHTYHQWLNPGLYFFFNKKMPFTVFLPQLKMYLIYDLC